MKKYLLIVLALMLTLVPNVAYAEVTSDEYTVFIDGEKQEFTAIVGDWDFYVPVEKFYAALGTKSEEDKKAQKRYYKLEKALMVIDLENETIVNELSSYPIESNLAVVDGEFYALASVLEADYDYETYENDEKKELHFISLEGILDRIATKNDKFKAEAPDLYAAVEKTITTPYGFNLNTNVIVQMDYPDEETAAMYSNIRRAVANAYINGYLNVPKDAFEMKMNFGFEAGPMMQAYEGFKITMLEDMMYMFDPLNNIWTSEKVSTDEAFSMSKELMAEKSTAYLWFLGDHMTKTEAANGVITYSASLESDDIKAMVDELTSEGFYDMIVEEIEKEDVQFEIDDVHLAYQLIDGDLRAQHVEMTIIAGSQGMTAKIIVAVDGEYYSYGLEKDVEVPSDEMLGLPTASAN